MTRVTEPAPRREMPADLHAQMRAALVHEAVRMARPDARRRPVLFTVTSAAAVGSLAVGAVVVGAQWSRPHSSKLDTVAAPSPTPASPSRAGRPAGRSAACEGMVLDDGPEFDALRYVPDSGAARRVTAWGTVLDADCGPQGNNAVALYTRPAVGALTAGVVALWDAPAPPAGTGAGGGPAPSAAAGLPPHTKVVDGITVTGLPGGAASLVWGGAVGGHLETVGLTEDAAVSLARAVRANGGTVPKDYVGLADWTAVPLDPIGDEATWYVEVRPAATPGAPSGAAPVQFNVRRRTANDQLAQALLRVGHNEQLVDIAGHPGLVIANGGSVTFAQWEQSDGILVSASVESSQSQSQSPLAELRQLAAGLTLVKAGDARFQAPDFGTTSPGASTSVTATTTAP